MKPIGELLAHAAVRLGQTASDKFDAVRQSGDLLVEIGAVEAPYVEAMLERERQISTSLGEGFAIPHGTDESRRWIRETKLVFLQYPEGVDWGDDNVKVCVGIAAVGDEHVGLLARLAAILIDPDQAARLREAKRVDDVLEILGSPVEDAEEAMS
jgi:mannitol/fructose-specific phosphotransferase system IIA component